MFDQTNNVRKLSAQELLHVEGGGDSGGALPAETRYVIADAIRVYGDRRPRIIDNDGLD